MGKSFLFNSRLCVTPTVASRAETDTSIESIEQLVSNYANSWADVMYDGNVFPQNYIKVVNSSNEIVAYEVSFCDRFTLEPMGYVVLSTDLSLENPVIEYTLDGNDIYSQQSVNNPSELSINHFEDMYSSYDNILISDNMITGAYYSVLKHTAILKAEAVLFIHFRSQLPAPGTPSIQ